MSAIDDVLESSRRVPRRGERHPPEPRLKLAVVTCMDARLDVYRLLGLVPGDAHVIRNAGGVASDDVLRALAVSQDRLGTREVMVVHHTGCAAGFDDERQAVRDDVARLRDSEVIRHRDQVRGFLYDLDLEALEEVTEER